VLISQPFAIIPSQSAYPTLQAEIPHFPLAQSGVEFGREQTTPHAPQLFTFDVVFISQPSAARLLQLANPAKQKEIVHAPAVQAAVAFGSESGQAVPSATGGFDGTPAVHRSAVQTLLSTSTLVLTITLIMLPAPSHWFWWQLPAV
jgi:hypothetical protein